MAVKTVMVDGREYPIAPLVPESHDHPSPAYPVAVTPEVARAWLAYNYRNRTQRESGKSNYSADMVEGNFAVNGATVTFSRPLRENEDPEVPAGKPCLMDGQHRLESCERGGAAFVTYVAYGISPDVRPTIDTGIKRSFGDALALRGEKNTLVLGSVIKRVHAWKNGDFHLTLKKGTATHAQMMEFFDEHPEVRRNAEIATRVRAEFELTTGHALRQSMIGLAHWLLMEVDDTLAPEFFARIGDGADMKTSHPVMHLRRRLVKDLTQKQQIYTRRELPTVADWQQLCYFIRTWNAYLVWLASSEDEREKLTTFALVGPLDSQKIPAIKTMKEVEKALGDQRLAAETALSA